MDGIVTMKIFLNQNVYDAALERIERIFREFPTVISSWSGGKDSTVTLFMALNVAEKLGRLPLKVLFLDQEAEWQCVIDYTREIMADPRVEPIWLQMPIQMTNSTSTTEEWLYAWRDGDEWMRAREPNSITENIYGTDRFHVVFPAYLKKHYKGQKVCYLAGVRAEESPSRSTGLTFAATYKDITWGKKQSQSDEHFNFYPLYDWSYTDIWKAIHDNKWPYCPIYDYFFQYGISPKLMRVSNLHHETAIHQLFYLQEIEGDTWNALTKRLHGVNAARHMTKKEMFQVGELPFMFEDWREYRDHLVDNLISEDKRPTFKRMFDRMEVAYSEMVDRSILWRAHVTSILANDYEFTKMASFIAKPEAQEFRKWKKGKPYNPKTAKWIPNHV